MIWHNGRLYLFDGWTRKRDPYFGWMTLRPAGRFPGYVRLIEQGTGHVLNLRADLVMLSATPV